MIRRLKISTDLWISSLKDPNPQRWRVVRNRLPEDARCVGMEYDTYPPTIILLIESAAFRDDDPIDLPSPLMERTGD